VNWSKAIRQIHRWLSIAFTVAVIANLVLVLQDAYVNWVGVLALVPLILLMLTGLYLFVLPYAANWRSERRTE
jgi:archaellum biogenesis protein FlaJ (TadC family)